MPTHVTVTATDTLTFADFVFGGASGSLQTPPRFPLALAATKDLLNWSNSFPSQPIPTLSAGMSATQTSIVLSAGRGVVFPTENFEVSIDDEIIFVGNRSGDTLSNCVRGAEQSTIGVHSAGSTVQLLVTALSHNQLVAEVVAIEQFLGKQGSNFPSIKVNGA